MLLQFKNISLVLFHATAESVNCSVFWKNLERHFCNVTCTKNFVKRVENLPQHLSEKIIGDNSSITDIALNNGDLSISPRAVLKLSITVIALVQKGLSCSTLSGV